jgi:hypothetical protein
VPKKYGWWRANWRNRHRYSCRFGSPWARTTTTAAVYCTWQYRRATRPRPTSRQPKQARLAEFYAWIQSLTTLSIFHPGTCRQPQAGDLAAPSPSPKTMK